MSLGKEIAQSTVVLLVGQAANLLLNLFVLVYIARSLGEQQFGFFSSLVATLAILGGIADFGLGPILVREMSKNPELSGKLIGSGIVLRSIFFLAAGVGYNVVAVAFDFNNEVILLTNIMMVNILISSKLTVHRNVFESFYRSQLRMSVPVFLSIVDNVILLLLCVMMLKGTASIASVVLIYTFSNLPGFLLMLYSVFWRDRLVPGLDRQLLKAMAKESLPIAVYSGLLSLYYSIDILLLRTLNGDYAVGVYVAAARLTGPLIFIANAVVHSLYPSLSKFVAVSAVRLKDTFVVGLKVLVVSGAAIGVAGFFASEFVVSLLYGGGFQESTVPLKILFWGQAFFFSNFYFASVMTAIGKQVVNTYIAGVTLALNIVLNILLIPQWSFTGVAAVKLGCDILSSVALYVFVRRELELSLASLMLKMLVITTSVVGVLTLMPSASIFLLAAVGATAFVVLLFLMKVFDHREIQGLKLIFGRNTP